jgi:hypothetical protein
VVVLNQQPAPRRARRDDLIALQTSSVLVGLFGPDLGLGSGGATRCSGS